MPGLFLLISIKATEKEIIKEVVLYKDKVIEKAKEIAGEKEVT